MLAGIIVLLALWGAGCVELEQVMVIRADGGGAITLHYLIDSQLLAAQASAQKAVEGMQTGEVPADKTAEQLKWILNEEKARAYFSDDNIRLQRYSSVMNSGKQSVTIECTMDNVSKALTTGKFGTFSLIKTEAGPYRLHADLPQGGEVSDPAKLERLRALTKGLKLQFAVQVPGKILTAPGAEIAGRTARWTFNPAQNDACLKTPPAIDLTYIENL